MVLAPCGVERALAEVSPVAEDLIRVVEFALLSTHALHTPLSESDVLTHAGRADGWGGWVAQEAPLPAQLERACVGGACELI